MNSRVEIINKILSQNFMSFIANFLYCLAKYIHIGMYVYMHVESLNDHFFTK